MSADFLQFALERGLVIKYLVSGRWARCHTTDHQHKQNGAYFFDGEYGHCQNWAIMDCVDSWQDGRKRTAFEQRELSAKIELSRKSQEDERRRNNARAAGDAARILAKCKRETHAYLDAHGMPEEIGLVWQKSENENLLVVPMYVDSVLSGVQTINRDGVKKFLYGQRCDRAEHVIGRGRINVWCEGYATAKAIYASCAALKLPVQVHACFSAGNVLKLAKHGFIVADNDASGTGERVAKACSLPFYMPGIEGEDFCDVWMQRGSLKMGIILQKFLMTS